MRIAIPVTDGCLAQHFGHCAQFAVVDVDLPAGAVTASTAVVAPPHQPGLLPLWLKERGVDLVIAGGVGSRAYALFQEASIAVLTGVAGDSAATVVQQYLAGTLATGENACDH